MRIDFHVSHNYLISGIYTFVSAFYRNGKQLVQTYLNDPKIREKLDFGYPINFVIHGWLSGLDGGNLYLPREVRQSDGTSHQN